jgi:hypothetical protein
MWIGQTDYYLDDRRPAEHFVNFLGNNLVSLNAKKLTNNNVWLQC